jgi:hypothetical protein
MPTLLVSTAVGPADATRASIPFHIADDRRNQIERRRARADHPDVDSPRNPRRRG